MYRWSWVISMNPADPGRYPFLDQNSSSKQTPSSLPSANPPIFPSLAKRTALKRLVGEESKQILLPLRLVSSIFAGGDAVTGPQTYTMHGAGRKAAISIDRYLKGEDLRAGREKKAPRKTISRWISTAWSIEKELRWPPSL